MVRSVLSRLSTGQAGRMSRSFCTLSDIWGKVRAAKITRTALVLVGPVLGECKFRDSALYDADYEHVLRNRKTKAAT